MITTPGGATSHSEYIQRIAVSDEIGIIHENEDLATGSTFARLEGGFSYRINSNASEQVKQTFSVDSDSGDVVLIKPLDYETHKVYYILIDASSSSNDKSTEPTYLVTIRFYVKDINDNAPVITTNTLTPNGLIEVAEDAAVGTFIAQLLVTDADSDKNGQFRCTFLDRFQPFNLIRTSINEYKMVTAAKLDREGRLQYRVQIVCGDRSDPPMTSQVLIVVHVLDVNDNAPIFVKDIFYADMYENAFYRDEMVRVEAFDADMDAITYRIIANASIPEEVRTRINSRTGSISIGVAHRDKSPMLKFLVTATDSGEPRRTSTATVIVTVVDIDDHSPRFDNDDYEFSIRSDAAINTTIGHIRATDPDEGINGEFTYSISSLYANRVGHLFAVSPKLGAITTRSRLDLEPKEEYKFTIYATGDGDQKLRTYTTVRIKIIHSPRNTAETDKPAVP
ncbi:protocadherin-11 X-linked-like [Tubulanus polymorphus]|uniref:protocadherin-11 X-linked-like n=1 Tax=Tubulanus polymorphus TaxID=672921 RepID=UPI003DA43CD0